MSFFQENLDGSIELNAPAKVNLFLHIIGRRPNGYHELESLFVFTEMGDKIRLEKQAGLSFALEGGFAKALSSSNVQSASQLENKSSKASLDNLVCKAARLLAQEMGVVPNVKITLVKNLPVSSGIGGGSSDAAVTLRGLVHLWELNVSDTRLCEIAFQLGADVPACLYRSPQYVTGVGEHLEARTIPSPYGILLVNSGQAVSTPDVFAAFKADSGNKFDQILAVDHAWPDDQAAFIEYLKLKTRNALQTSAEACCPAISEVLECLRAAPLVKFVGMSGSGATCFALFDTKEQAVIASRHMKAAKPDWWVMADHLCVA